MDENKAIIVVDMINDFVTGRLGGEYAEAIVPDVRELLEKTKEKHMMRIFVQDSHEEDDPEIPHWGQHAMKDEEGSETIPELQGLANKKINKRFYDSFYKTDLEKILKQNGIDRVILVGVTTDICIQNTAAGAFYRGFDITVLKDCTAALSKERHENALEYMRTIFGVEVSSSEEIIATMAPDQN